MDYIYICGCAEQMSRDWAICTYMSIHQITSHQITSDHITLHTFPIYSDPYWTGICHQWVMHIQLPMVGYGLLSFFFGGSSKELQELGTPILGIPLGSWAKEDFLAEFLQKFKCRGFASASGGFSISSWPCPIRVSRRFKMTYLWQDPQYAFNSDFNSKLRLRMFLPSSWGLRKGWISRGLKGGASSVPRRTVTGHDWPK